MSAPTITVRPPQADEFEPWAVLFRAYREFYLLAPDDAVVARVWSWIQDPDHEINALVAVADDGTLIGLAHHRRFARPTVGRTARYLDDLLVSPDHRGGGVGRALIAALAEIAAGDGCDIVRWITDHDNVTAHRLYDDVAERKTWVTYDLRCGEQ